MIETADQFERAEEAIGKMKRFLLAARRTHAPEAYAALSAPILRELQERERDVLLYLSQIPPPPAKTVHSGSA
jgi:hypothetical protein